MKKLLFVTLLAACGDNIHSANDNPITPADYCVKCGIEYQRIRWQDGDPDPIQQCERVPCPDDPVETPDAPPAGDGSNFEPPPSNPPDASEPPPPPVDAAEPPPADAAESDPKCCVGALEGNVPIECEPPPGRCASFFCNGQELTVCRRAE